ncbi:MAG TPA: flagellar hook-basal body complex protein FliE [Solirubrobacteraceae bacterium]|jgi:flagellar hook-basal body complex protein FliE
MILPAIGAVGHAASIPGLYPPTATTQSGPASAVAPALEGTAGAGPSGGFEQTLMGAISSLEATQQNAASAAQGLATGKVSDPESAVVTVEDAQLAMDLASQIRNKATEVAQSIFQIQV